MHADLALARGPALAATVLGCNRENGPSAEWESAVNNQRVRATSVIVATAAALALLYFLRGIIVPLIVALVLLVLVQALVRAISNQWRIMPDWLVSFFAAYRIQSGGSLTARSIWPTSLLTEEGRWKSSGHSR